MRLRLFTLALLVPSLGCVSDQPGSDTTAESSSGGADSTPDPTTSTSTDPADTSGGDTTDTGAEATGEQLYMQLCASCHGPEGEGSVLAYEVRHPRREYARWVVRNGRTGAELAPSVMAPFGEDLLSDAELDRIFDYLDAFPAETTGEGLYLDHCRACHGVDAAGGESQKDIRFELNEALEKVRQGEGGTDYGARTGYMPSWSTAELSDDDVAAIVTYVEGL
jgi:mono/diheme cytochrome c family protein